VTDFHAITDDGVDLVMRVVDGVLVIVAPAKKSIPARAGIAPPPLNQPVAPASAAE
jgi:hypothetical protein